METPRKVEFGWNQHWSEPFSEGVTCDGSLQMDICPQEEWTQLVKPEYSNDNLSPSGTGLLWIAGYVCVFVVLMRCVKSWNLVKLYYLIKNKTKNFKHFQSTVIKSVPSRLTLFLRNNIPTWQFVNTSMFWNLLFI